MEKENITMHDDRLKWIIGLVTDELERATQNPANTVFNSYHEGFAVLWEEVDELWDEVKASKPVSQGYSNEKEMQKEAIQVAAMAMRFIYDLLPYHLQE